MALDAPPEPIWLRCPNDPPCAHGGLLHDGDGDDEPFICGVDGCDCRGTLTLCSECGVFDCYHQASGL